jgi:hypothetical protein
MHGTLRQAVRGRPGKARQRVRSLLGEERRRTAQASAWKIKRTTSLEVWGRQGEAGKQGYAFRASQAGPGSVMEVDTASQAGRGRQGDCEASWHGQTFTVWQRVAAR